MHYEHGGAFIACAYQRFAGGEDMDHGRFRQLPQFVSGKRSEDIDRRQAIGDLIFRSDWQNGRLPFELNRSGRKSEAEAVSAQRIPNSLTNQRISVVIFRVVFEPILNFPFNCRLAKVSYAHYWSNLVRNIVRIADRFAN